MTRDAFTFHDYQPEALNLQDAVVRGLSLERKSIPPKFFYDRRGSELFAEICEQPEYYPPTVERRMLISLADEIAALVGPGRVIIEPGAGGAEKVRLLIERLAPAAYVPMDISCAYVRDAARGLVSEYPELRVHAVCVDFTHSLPLPEPVPDRPRLVFFPGSSLGNFEPAEAEEFLRLCRATSGKGGMMLIGVDTRKDPRILDAAYNDAAGVTAAFNLNLLQRIREELESDCRTENFRHLAFYNAERGRIEMHLVSRRAHQVRVNGRAFDFAEGEALHTENSYKYGPDEFLDMAQRAGFRPVRHWLDVEGLFAIYLLGNN